MLLMIRAEPAVMRTAVADFAANASGIVPGLL
jgi:hypothetical protein